MKKLCVCVAAAASIALGAPRAEAKIAAIYGSGQAGLQTRGDTGAQYGFELGAHVLIFDGYVDYMGFGSGRSVSRAIVGLRGGLGTGAFRLVLRAGVGAIREASGALTTSLGATTTLTRTGGDARAGAAVEGRLYHGLWLGVGADGEVYGFLGNSLGFASHGTNVLGVVKLTVELGI
jgi:hypothetical protein